MPLEETVAPCTLDEDEVSEAADVDPDGNSEVFVIGDGIEVAGAGTVATTMPHGVPSAIVEEMFGAPAVSRAISSFGSGGPLLPDPPMPPPPAPDLPPSGESQSNGGGRRTPVHTGFAWWT